MNYPFKIEDWILFFPLQENYERYQGWPITSPFHLCNNEQLRQEISDQVEWGDPIPADVFVMVDGEPQHRSVTKIGGLPYRGTGRAWPSGSEGDPLLFLAQFNFSDSRDFIGELPGEILLVFGDNSGGPFDSLYFEWVNEGTANLVGPDEIPVHPKQFLPCYGHIHRTISFPYARWRERSTQARYPLCRGREVWSGYWLLQYQATQIGKAPFFIQKGDDGLPGTILCTISSVGESVDQPFPWINQRQPIPLTEFRYGDHLIFADTGCIYISIDAAQNLHWRESSF